ncbi:hypothetical protein U0070_014784 [Myodes glareolus]|uniref:UBX domain-containing protein n=1 Tax=Myodes glareolus TaxID=447135 RepID=A0AAW0ICI7_MYOGA
MASRGVVGLFLLSALPLLCLELRRGIPSFGIKDLILLSGRIFLLLALLTLVISVATSWFNSPKPSRVHVKEGEENEKRQRLVRKKQQEAQGEQNCSVVFDQGDEELVLGNSSQTSFETANREAARRRNLPKLLTEVSPPAPQPAKKEVPDLPDEPSETAEEVLLDWMMRIGYHKSLYSLSTSFPRRPLAVEGGLSLEDIGITVDTVLNVEEKERSGQ